MAGLLDIFGTGGTNALSLLGGGDIQQARDDAQAQALYALAGRMFQGGNTGASIAQGLQLGQQAYKQAMQSELQDRLQTYQLQEYAKKKQEEEAAKKNKEVARKLLMSGYIPESSATTYGSLTPQQIERAAAGEMQVPQQTTVTPATYDFSKVAPVLLAGAAGQEGIDELLKRLQVQKAMTGEATKLGEGERLLRQNPFTNKMEEVATGAPKVQRLSGKEGNAALMFYGTDDVNQLRNIPGAVDRIRAEATMQRKSEQPQINLADSTAVQTQQLKTINQWEGLLKDSGDNVVASRANAFYDAYNQAKKGNVSGDGAMIYHAAKQYDTTGAVQQGDVGTIIGNRSIPTQIQLFAQKFAKGGTFTPQERENLKSIIDGLVDTRKKMIEPSLKTYRKINKSLGGTDDAIPNPYDLITKPQSLDEILGG